MSGFVVVVVGVAVVGVGVVVFVIVGVVVGVVLGVFSCMEKYRVAFLFLFSLPFCFFPWLAFLYCRGEIVEKKQRSRFKNIQGIRKED